MFNEIIRLSESILSMILSEPWLIYALHSHMLLTRNQIKFGSLDGVSFWDFKFIWTWNTSKTYSCEPTQKENKQLLNPPQN